MKQVLISFILFFSFTAYAKNPKNNRQPNSESFKGNLEFVSQGKYSFLRIEGDAAKNMYDLLQSAAKNNQGEAGAEVFFKNGTSYNCFADAVDRSNPQSNNVTNHVCNISIKNPSLGLVK